ncbi:SDR family oxidoreductase [Pseudomonas sp. GD03842]|uniref:SDR family oxidoreductase n=1 Tax=unclassified Pseudomonas TaxID=196821 RepID=UPI000D349B42|nr:MULTISPECIES: SDR family oxidoreductase [unclassified Pseudomonas]MDH0745025.1 SDR family oxidoreductase [Pseudomonas sp. GD03842]RAU48117.1 SDR family NAD(P)-dependent oxidoreductase [Pseudomonas sp. RIT 409]RAU55185.1 SDR family NAD(P)-dependent oxidoreductase [Pseudomonas sp. RIT 412]
MKGKTALVTGSSDGLGLAIGARLAAAGCQVVLHGLAAADTMGHTCDELMSKHGVNVRYVYADLSDIDQIEHLFAEAGPVDVLVNNAVVRYFSPIEDFPLAHWNQALAVNLTAALRAIQSVLPGMRARQWGRIVNLSSAYGARGIANRVDYVTTKTALLGMTRAVAVETQGQGITCNAVSPGSVLTPNIEGRLRALMADKQLDRDTATRMFLQGKQATGRFVDASHVADLIVYLCSESAGSITGATLPVDDGWMAG